MESKRDYRAQIKNARKEFRSKMYGAGHDYRATVKKFKLLKKQEEIRDELKIMGVPNRQIPVTIIEGRAQKIKVRVGV